MLCTYTVIYFNEVDQQKEANQRETQCSIYPFKLQRVGFLYWCVQESVHGVGITINHLFNARGGLISSSLSLCLADLWSKTTPSSFQFITKVPARAIIYGVQKQGLLPQIIDMKMRYSHRPSRPPPS